MEVVAGGMFLVILLLAAINLIAIIWAIADIIKRPALNSTEKLIWILVVLILELIGVLLYALVGRK